MEIREIAPELSVAGQLTPADVDAVVAGGFRSIVINRPDGEGDDQPPSAELVAAATRAGLATRYIPVVSGNLTDRDVADFDRALRELPAPVLAFCRSGTRSAILWALSQAGRRSTAAILEAAADAGYDLSAIEPRLASRASASNEESA